MRTKLIKVRSEEDRLRCSEGTRIEQLAVAAAARDFSSWVWEFREQVAYEFGIDAVAEEVDDGFPTGRVLALVFKGGQEPFSGTDADGWQYRVQNSELTYWLSYSMPVVSSRVIGIQDLRTGEVAPL